MPLKNYSTEIPVDKTVTDMQKVLARHGAKSITVEYDNGEPAVVRFRYPTQFGELPFRVPVAVEPVWRYLVNKGQEVGIDRRFRTKQQAARIAWRSGLDWLKLQLDFVDTGMVSFEQAMFGYLTAPGGRTYYELMVPDLKALPEAGHSTADN